MKNISPVLTLLLALSVPTLASAMTLADVTQQLAIYKSAPAVLGASTNGMTSTEVQGSLPPQGPKVLLQALKYAKGSSNIIDTPIHVGSVDKDNIKTLQVFLVAKGYLNADPTGTFGPLTRAALKKFQIEKGIVGGNGTLVGPMTMKAISADVDTTTAMSI